MKCNVALWHCWVCGQLRVLRKGGLVFGAKAAISLHEVGGLRFSCVSRAPRLYPFILTGFWSPVLVVDLVPSRTVPAAYSMALWLKASYSCGGHSRESLVG